MIVAALCHHTSYEKLFQSSTRDGYWEIETQAAFREQAVGVVKVTADSSKTALLRFSIRRMIRASDVEGTVVFCAQVLMTHQLNELKHCH